LILPYLFNGTLTPAVPRTQENCASNSFKDEIIILWSRSSEALVIVQPETVSAGIVPAFD
jgi:hypothetical protein